MSSVNEQLLVDILRGGPLSFQDLCKEIEIEKRGVDMSKAEARKKLNNLLMQCKSFCVQGGKWDLSKNNEGKILTAPPSVGIDAASGTAPILSQTVSVTSKKKDKKDMEITLEDKEITLLTAPLCDTIDLKHNSDDFATASPNEYFRYYRMELRSTEKSDSQFTLSNDCDIFTESCLLGFKVMKDAKDTEMFSSSGLNMKDSQDVKIVWSDDKEEDEKEGDEEDDDDVDDDDDKEGHDDDEVFLNLHQPFCAIAVGVQGSGKSHSMNNILEACFVSAPPYLTIERPLSGLVLHFDPNSAAVCESLGLARPSQAAQFLSTAGSMPQITVFVSPTNFKQRQLYYKDFCAVQPLLFSWQSLTLNADHLKRIMNLEDGQQLYVATMFNLLRGWQREGKWPTFDQFRQIVMDKCKAAGQAGPLEQRLNLLETFIAESKENQKMLQALYQTNSSNVKHIELLDHCQSHSLVIVDLSDPLLGSEEANGVFQVLVQQYRTKELPGKVLLLDEAHRYMKGSLTQDGLSRAIVDTARMMRHDGMRLLVSTQSPLTLPAELLELVSVAFLHSFSSTEWFRYLQNKIAPLKEEHFNQIMSLKPGYAMLYAPRSGLRDGVKVSKLLVRQRVTMDLGNTRLNKIGGRGEEEEETWRVVKDIAEMSLV